MKNRNEKKIMQLNILATMISQILMLIANYFSKQAILKQLGKEYLGLQTVFGNFCDLLSVFFAAAGMVMLFSMYSPLENCDVRKLTGLFHYYKKVYKIITGGMLLVGTCLLGVVLWCVDAEISTWDIVKDYLLYLVSVLVYDCFQYNYFYLMADQRRYIGCMIQGVGDAAALIPEIMILYVFHNYSLFLLVIAAKNIIELSCLSLVRQRYYPYLKKKSDRLSEEESHEINKNIVDMVISKIGNLLLYNTDSIIISAIVSTAAAGCYSNYYFIFQGLQAIVWSVFDTLLPKIGQLSVRDTEEEQYNTYRKACLLNVVIVSVCISGVYWLSKDLLILWMGEEVLLSDKLIPVMCITQYISMVRYASLTYRQAKGLFAKISWVVLLRGVLNIIISIMLGLKFGLLGIVAATAISDGLTVFWYEPKMLLKSFGKNMKQEFLYQCLTIFVLGSSLVLCGKVLYFIQGISWIIFIVKVFTILAVCMTWMILLYSLAKILHITL